jgi:HAMP domain-containing protein
LKQSRIHDNSDLAVINIDDSTVFADTFNETTRTTSQLIVDTGFITQDKLDELIGHYDIFKGEWTPDEAGIMLDDCVVFCPISVYTAYPLPLPPKEYDPSYRPERLVIQRIPKDVFAVSEAMNAGIDKELLHISLLTVGVGLIGMILVMIIVYFVSRALTRPLLWIKRVAWSIVNHASDDRSRTSIGLNGDPENAPHTRWVPKTEISELVSEFRMMIKGFSGGKGASTIAHGVLHEIPNHLTWQSDYQQLYNYSSKPKPPSKESVRRTTVSVSSSDTSGDGSVELNDRGRVCLDTLNDVEESNDAKQSEGVLNALSIVPAPSKKNVGRNNMFLSPSNQTQQGIKHRLATNRAPAHRSALFWWILGLIVLPLVLTNITIGLIASGKVTATVENWLQKTSDESLSLELKALKSTAILKSTLARIRLSDVVRDLHLATRFAGWLLFDGVIRSSAFAYVEQGTQECRAYADGDTCPFFKDRVCDCRWEDPHPFPCTDVNYTDPRTLQKQFFMCQARDADNATGARLKAESFNPLLGIDNSPNNTLWWDDVNNLPGAEKASAVSGAETTYDRLRVSSAMAVITIPIYNYATVLSQPKNDLLTAVAFQADGMLTGYR